MIWMVYILHAREHLPDGKIHHMSLPQHVVLITDDRFKSVGPKSPEIKPLH